MAKKETKKGALAQDPAVRKANANQRRYQRAMAGLRQDPNSTKWKEQANKYFNRLNPQQQNQEMSTLAGQYYGPMMARYQQYDPTQGFQNEQSYTDQLNAARQTVMNQFESTMGPEFQRQDAQFAQQMAEQGIDPNSGAYQAQYRALKQAQDASRQSAMTNAFTLGAEYQQQGFQQGKEAFLAPSAVWQATQTPWELQQKANIEAANRQAQLESARMSSGAGIAQARIGAEAQRDVAAMDMMSRYGQKPTNPWAAAGAGFLGSLAKG